MKGIRIFKNKASNNMGNYAHDYIYLEGLFLIIIYHDVGGAHSTQTAASLHLNLLPKDRVPTAEELMALPRFDRAEKSDHGRIQLTGIDEYGNTVYTLGREYTEKMTITALKDLYVLLKGDLDGLIIVNMKPTINLLMKIGGYSSRRLHLVNFGRPIVIKGTQKAFFNIVSLVDQVKEAIKSGKKFMEFNENA